MEGGSKRRWGERWGGWQWLEHLLFLHPGQVPQLPHHHYGTVSDHLFILAVTFQVALDLALLKIFFSFFKDMARIEQWDLKCSNTTTIDRSCSTGSSQRRSILPGAG